MGKSIEDVCEELDNLSIRSLELIEEKVLVNLQLEKLIREGNIELAKARYIRGKESIGTLQIPQDDQMSSLFELETSTTQKREKDIPCFDISLKNGKDGKEHSDPIKWFGVLVPHSLKSAQKRFQESLYLTAKVANVNAELECIPSEIESLRNLKSTLAK